MSATAEMIKELRLATGAGILECRNALESTGGDLEKASELLREGPGHGGQARRPGDS